MKTIPKDAKTMREMIHRIRCNAQQEEHRIIQSFQEVCRHQILVEMRGLRGCYMDDGWDPGVPSQRLCLECGLTEKSQERGWSSLHSGVVDPVLSDHFFRTLVATPRKLVGCEDFRQLQREGFLTISLSVQEGK